MSNTNYSVESMICVVQCYIHILKNKEVQIRVTNFKEINQLKQAHEIAKNWLSNYNFKIYG